MFSTEGVSLEAGLESVTTDETVGDGRGNAFCVVGLTWGRGRRAEPTKENVNLPSVTVSSVVDHSNRTKAMRSVRPVTRAQTGAKDPLDWEKTQMKKARVFRLAPLIS